MDKEVLWEKETHTEAKHRVLAKYLDGWFPIMANLTLKHSKPTKPPQILVIDGYAGPGQYKDKSVGSPLIMLRRLLNQPQFDRWQSIEFKFLFVEACERRAIHLEEMLAKESLPENISYVVKNSTFEAGVASLLDGLDERGSFDPPVFTFIDPYGYSVPMDLVDRLLSRRMSEALWFLPFEYINRFVSSDAGAAARTKLFSGEGWKDAKELGKGERREFLMELFESNLRAKPGVKFTHSFRLKSEHHNDYRLVFALGDKKGVQLAKDAAWAVDPASGSTFDANSPPGQGSLFVAESPDLALLLRKHFGDLPFTTEEAEEFLLLSTRSFRPAHLREGFLVPCEKSGSIEVKRASSRGFGGATIRFLIQ